MTSEFAALALAAGVALAPFAGQAQDAATDDWSYLEQGPARVAFVEYSSGVSLAFRCEDRRLWVAMNGLPALTTEHHRFDTMRPDGRTATFAFTRQDGREQVINREGARFARFMRTSGVVSLESRDGQDQRMQIAFDLPGQHTNLDRLLQACGQPLTNDRDTLPSLDAARLRSWPRPQPVTPSDHRPRHVEISCVVNSEGRLSQCRAEGSPSTDRWTVQTVRSYNDIRLDMPDPQSADGQVFRFSVEGFTRTTVTRR